MTVSRENSKMVYDGIKAAGIRFVSALPETWLVYLLQLAEDDPEMCLVEVAKEEEAIGIAAGAYFAGRPNALLMQNHGFFGAINGLVSLALLYRIPLLMLIAYRGHIGEPYPWHTQVLYCAADLFSLTHLFLLQTGVLVFPGSEPGYLRPIIVEYPIE